MQYKYIILFTIITHYIINNKFINRKYKDKKYFKYLPYRVQDKSIKY